MRMKYESVPWDEAMDEYGYKAKNMVGSYKENLDYYLNERAKQLAFEADLADEWFNFYEFYTKD